MNPLEKYITAEQFVDIVRDVVKKNYNALRKSIKFMRLTHNEYKAVTQFKMLAKVGKVFYGVDIDIIYCDDISSTMFFVVDGESEVIYLG